MPFVQLGNPKQNNEKGLGLGLSIVKASMAILSEHEFGMCSMPGRGTRFGVEIPRAHAIAPLAESVDHLAKTLDLASLFVWCIENDDVSHAPVGPLLVQLGIFTQRTSSFEELERELRLDPLRPDLLIMGNRLPGNHTADEVISLFDGQWSAEIPAIVLSSEAASRSCEVTRGNLEILDLFSSPEEIIKAIRRLCFSHEPAAEE